MWKQYFGTESMKQKYSLLLSGDNHVDPDTETKQVRPRHQEAQKSIIIYVLLAAVILLSLVSASLFATRNGNSKTLSALGVPGAAIPDPTEDDPGHFDPHLDGVEIIEVGNCGNSSEEARAKGCIFDVMSILWVTPDCYDKELADEFRVHWDHEWWQHRKADPEDLVSYDTVAAGEWKYLWVEWQYHQLHCTFMWRKMHRAILNHWPMEDRLMSWGHTLHCEDMLVNWPEYQPRDINTRTILGYAKCLLPGKPKVQSIE